MKRLLLISLVLATSCTSPFTEPDRDLDFAVQLPDGVYTESNVLDWVAENITYAKDREEFAQTPGETMRRRAGDCEDFAILDLALLAEIGIEANFVYTHFPGDRAKSHAVIEVYGFLVEPQSAKVVHDLSVDERLTYAQIKKRMNDMKTGLRQRKGATP